MTWILNSHENTRSMYAGCERDGQCDKPTLERHGWLCGQGSKHEGPCIPSRDEVARMLDDASVDAFAGAMKAKLAEARAKGRGGWNRTDECSQSTLSEMLRAHVHKGDPRDVANFCMFLHQRGESIMPSQMDEHAEPITPATVSVGLNIDAAESEQTTPIHQWNTRDNPWYAAVTDACATNHMQWDDSDACRQGAVP